VDGPGYFTPSFAWAAGDSRNLCPALSQAATESGFTLVFPEQRFHPIPLCCLIAKDYGNEFWL